MKKKISILMVVMAFIAILQIPVLSQARMNDGGTEKDIVEIAQSDDRFTTLVTALEKAELVDALKADGEFTVFAPTNDAFEKLPAEVLEKLLQPENKDKLAKVLTYHVYDGKVLAEDVVKLDGQRVKMLNNKCALIEIKDDEVYIDGAKVIITDIMAKNGVIHVIDSVMLP